MVDVGIAAARITQQLNSTGRDSAGRVGWVKLLAYTDVCKPMPISGIAASTFDASMFTVTCPRLFDTIAVPSRPIAHKVAHIHST